MRIMKNGSIIKVSNEKIKFYAYDMSFPLLSTD